MSFAAMAFATLTAVATQASSPAIRGHSRTFVLLGARPYYSSTERGLVERNVAPILQEIFLDAHTGLEGTTVVVDAWMALEAGGRVLANRGLADLGQAYVRIRREAFTLTIGRTVVFSPTGRALRTDGGWLELHPDLVVLGGRPRLEVWGGIPVQPSFGEEPLAGSTPVFTDDPLELARGGAQWSRPGDWAIGATAGLRYPSVADVSFGYVRVQDLAEVFREAIVAHVALTPGRNWDIEGFGSLDVYGAAVEEAELGVSSWATKDLRLRLYGRFADPSLLLPSTSILSVFGGPTHADLGLEADLFWARRARFSAAAEVRRVTVDTEEDGVTGYRLAASVRGAVPGLSRVRTTVGGETVSDDWYGSYQHLRVGVELGLTEAMALSLDGAAFVTQSVEPGGSSGPRRSAWRTGAAGRYAFDGWQVVIATRATHVAGLMTDVSVLGRLEWNVEYVF